MEEKYADLHIHSYFSDGTMSPEEIVKEAKARNLGLMAITDHNMLEGSRQAEALCEEAGIGYVPAVELDCLDGGDGYHVLAYGADLDHAGFAGMVQRNRYLLDEMSVILIRKMSPTNPGISLSEYLDFPHDKRLGGWKALQYFMHKGLAGSLKEGLALYEQYACPFSVVDFPSISHTCNMIHQAGGYAVLAHPAENIPRSDMEYFINRLSELLEKGLDGIECHYPTHTKELTTECIRMCRERDLIITAGSDCHGTFGKTAIGQTMTRAGELHLKGIYPVQKRS